MTHQRGAFTMLKQGYLLEVTTWENHGDYYKTKRLGGLSKSQVTFMLALLGHFKSVTNEPIDAPLFGNSGLYKIKSNRNRSFSQFVDAMSKLRNQYPNEFDIFFKHTDDQQQSWDEIHASFSGEDNDIILCRYYHDTLAKILGYTEDCWDEDCFFRVVHEINVFNIPVDIDPLPLESFNE